MACRYVPAKIKDRHCPSQSCHALMSSTVPCRVQLATRAPCFPGCVPRLSGRVGNVLSKILSLLRNVVRYDAAARRHAITTTNTTLPCGGGARATLCVSSLPCRVAGLRRRRSLRRSRRGGKAPITTTTTTTYHLPPAQESRRISVAWCVWMQGFRTGEHWTKTKGGRGEGEGKKKKKRGLLALGWVTACGTVDSFGPKDMRLDVSSRRS